MNRNESSFRPNWASAPGETISDILKERNISEIEFAKKMNFSNSHANALLTGRIEISAEIAQRLGDLFGTPAKFWIAREFQYREDLEILRHESQAEGVRWLSELPINDMIRYGWLKDAVDRLDACLSFFNVTNVQAWREKYQTIFKEAAFRTSPTFRSEAGALAAWLRQGEIESDKLDCRPWNARLFKEILQEIRSLTRKRQPGVFIPELQKRCADCGVAIAILRAPSGCRASGATRFLSPIKASLLLSCRYLSDDHFWFTFFHESGHLLLHGKDAVFLEGTHSSDWAKEDEANAFAADTLIARELYDEMLNLPMNALDIARFAKKAGVSPGVVVGQLQHVGRIKQNHFNGLKVRFQWVGQ